MKLYQKKSKQIIKTLNLIIKKLNSLLHLNVKKKK